MKKPKQDDMPFEGPGVAPVKHKDLDKLGDQLSDLRENKSKLAEKITEVEKRALDRMTIKTITVRAGRTFNHPHEQYSNLRPSVAMVAELAEGEDPIAATKQLQQQAEGLVEDHKQGLLKSLEELYQLTERQAEMRGLQEHLSRAQDRLSEIRRSHPELILTNGEE